MNIGTARLVFSVMVIVITWTVLLPLIGRQPAVAEHISTQQKLDINPSALFYTELSMSSDVANHIERLRDANSSAFWSVSRTSSLQEPAKHGEHTKSFEGR